MLCVGGSDQCWPFIRTERRRSIWLSFDSTCDSLVVVMRKAWTMGRVLPTTSVGSPFRRGVVSQFHWHQQLRCLCMCRLTFNTFFHVCIFYLVWLVFFMLDACHTTTAEKKLHHSSLSYIYIFCPAICYCNDRRQKNFQECLLETVPVHPDSPRMCYSTQLHTVKRAHTPSTIHSTVIYYLWCSDPYGNYQIRDSRRERNETKPTKKYTLLWRGNEWVVCCIAVMRGRDLSSPPCVFFFGCCLCFIDGCHEAPSK